MKKTNLTVTVDPCVKKRISRIAQAKGITVSAYINSIFSRPESVPDEYWERVSMIEKTQTEKGINSYGMRIEDNTDKDIVERITYLEEELVDALKYIEWAKDILSN